MPLPCLLRFPIKSCAGSQTGSALKMGSAFRLVTMFDGDSLEVKEAAERSCCFDIDV